MSDETQEALKIHFHMGENIINELETEEYEALERAQDGEIKLYRIRPLIARFLANDDNSRMDHAKAMKLLAKLKVSQWKQVFESFMQAIKDSTVPKENGG